MKKGMPLVLFLSALVLACAGSEDFDVFPGHQPVIHASYAPSVIRPGAAWRVYLHAEDYDGDMKEIVILVTQTGTPPFPTSIVKLKDQDATEVAGYLWLATTNDVNMLGDRIEAIIVVRDRRDNTSEPLKFSLRFAYQTPQEIPERWKGPADRQLGVLSSDIAAPSQGRPTRGEGL
jgi:hypothetical protein